MSRTLCASWIATGIVRQGRSGRAAVLCDELVPDDVEKCPACGSESPATRARFVVERMAHAATMNGRGHGNVKATVQRNRYAKPRVRDRKRVRP